MGVHISLEDDVFTVTLKGKSLYGDVYFSHDISTPYTLIRSWFTGLCDLLYFNAPHVRTNIADLLIHCIQFSLIQI